MEEAAALPLPLKIGEIRYFFRWEHEHPLTLTDISGREEEGTGTCRSCRESPSGLTYSCGSCEFYLHKICTGRPDTIGHPLHPHPLVRDFCTGPICGSCGSTYDRDFNFYKCLSCDFSLDETCALSAPLDPEIDRLACQLCHSAMELIEQHEKNEEPPTFCIICREQSPGPMYTCPSCEFFVHESCSNEVSEIRHPSHPFHALSRTDNCIFMCNNCLVDWYGTSYRCKECDFDLDFKCSFLVPQEEFEGKEPILMDIHRHPLAPTYDDDVRNRDCVVCYEPCSMSTYSCRGCKFSINVHKSCTIIEVPKLLHFRGHALPKSYGMFTCDECLKDRFGFYYGLTDTKLDVRCAYLDRPVIVFDGHDHPLVFVEDFDGKGTCDGCGKRFIESSSSVFHCPTCDFKLHMLCGPLPSTIKQQIHMDVLVLKDSLVEDLTGDEEFYCDSCEERRDPSECVYYCDRCLYCAEIKCVATELKLALTGKSGDVELRTLGRWSRSGKVLSRGLLSEKIEQCGIDNSTTIEPEPGCFLKDILQSLTKDEKLELDNILNENNKLFDHLTRECDPIQDALPYSDEEFVELVRRLDSVKLTDLEKTWEPDLRFVRKGEYLVPEPLVRVYNDLYRKYGDVTEKTKLSIPLKAILFLPLCRAVEGICSTKVVDITETELIKWWISVKAVRSAGFKVQFTVDAMEVVVKAYYGLLFRRNLDREIQSLEEEIPRNKETLEELEGELKRHKEYFESEEPSLVKECIEEGSSLMYKTAGEVVLP